ncbi:Uncharacterised protein [Vibrio cholerae]|nr:Uncharacterised protein [Vibrio cholerae]
MRDLSCSISSSRRYWLLSKIQSSLGDFMLVMAYPL